MHGNFLPEIRERVSDSLVICVPEKQILNTVCSCQDDDIIILDNSGISCSISSNFFYPMFTVDITHCQSVFIKLF